MLFSRQLSDNPILIGGEQMIRVFEIKFVGVLVQSNPEWNYYVNSVANEISKSIGILHEAKNSLI